MAPTEMYLEHAAIQVGALHEQARARVKLVHDATAMVQGPTAMVQEGAKMVQDTT